MLAEKWFNIWISNIVYWLVLLLTIKCIKIHMKLLTLNKHITVAGTDFQDVGLWLSPTGLRTNFKSLTTKVRYVEHLSTVYEHGWSHYSAEWGSLWKWCVGCNWPTDWTLCCVNEIHYFSCGTVYQDRHDILYDPHQAIFCYMLIRIKRCYYHAKYFGLWLFLPLIFGIMSLLY